MKYLKKFEEVDRSLNKEDKSEIMGIFQSIISDDNFYEYEGTYDNNQILYKIIK